MAKAGMIIKTKKISDLKPAPYNPRTSTKKQEDNLAESLKKFGVVEPIIFNETTGHIVGGHFRVRELKKLGYKEVECVIVELSEADEKELNIRLNANTGAWDFDELANNWNAEDLEKWGLEIPNFNMPEEITGDFQNSKNDHDVFGGNTIPVRIGNLIGYLTDESLTDIVARITDEINNSTGDTKEGQKKRNLIVEKMCRIIIENEKQIKGVL